MTPSSAAADISLADGLQSLGHVEKAAEYYERALEREPGLASALMGLAAVSIAQGDLTEALRRYRRAIELHPNDPIIYQNLLLALHYTSQDPAQLFSAHAEYERRYAARLVAAYREHSNSRTAERRLRVGYVSADFRRHSVAYFFEPRLAAHDRGEFDITCYAHVGSPDDVTARLQVLSDQWRPIYGWSNEQVAQQIRTDQIDILVDLGGHTNPRLIVFASKPAPVQVTYLGYPDTTGLSTMDYRITDAWSDPPNSTESFYSERLVRLPSGFQCYQPSYDSPAVGPLPALAAGQVTFASFNALPKVTPYVVAVWARILRAVPESRLFLKASALRSPAARQRLLGLFEAHGIPAERLELLGQARSVNDHLDLYNRVDIALDPFPYNGATTTCEALWMGVPVVSIAGQTHVGRVGVSLLQRVGLSSLIADSEEAYVSTAVKLASNTEGLIRLRAGLREQAADSSLMNAAQVTRSLERAYREMWREWCAAQVNSPRTVRNFTSLDK